MTLSCTVIGVVIAVALIPGLFVLNAWRKNRKRRNDLQARIATKSTEHQDTDLYFEIEKLDQKTFHNAEFTALKSEIAEIIKAAAANFQYALVGSAAVLTWLAPGEHTVAHVLTTAPYAALLPFVLSCLFFWLTSGLYIRISEISRYLRKLEIVLGHEKLGWEKEFAGHGGTLGPIYLCGWIVLLIGDLIAALYLLSISS